MTVYKIEADRIFDLASEIFRQRLISGVHYPEGDAKAFVNLFRDIVNELNSPTKQSSLLTESLQTE